MFHIYNEQEKCPKIARAAALVWLLFDEKTIPVLNPPFGPKREQNEAYFAALEAVKEIYGQARDLLLQAAGEKDPEEQEDRKSAQQILLFLLDLVVPLPGDFWYPTTQFERDLLAEIARREGKLEDNKSDQLFKLVTIFAA